MDTWYITLVLDQKNSVAITGYGSDPRYPERVETVASGPLGRVLLEEIRSEVIYPPEDMTWALQSENDLYGWHAAAGSVIDRRREPWKVDHNLP
jgi:hypothetical protein